MRKAGVMQTEAATVTPLPEVRVVRLASITTVPPFIVVLNRLARLGKAFGYGGEGNRFAWFDFVKSPDGAVLEQKWADFIGVERITLIYEKGWRNR